MVSVNFRDMFLCESTVDIYSIYAAAGRQIVVSYG